MTDKLRGLVSAAVQDDIPGILAVQEANMLSVRLAAGVDRQQLENEGLLIHRVLAMELEYLIGRPDKSSVFVYKEADAVIGYGIGFVLSVLTAKNPDWISTIRFHTEADRDLLLASSPLYYRQAGVVPNRKRQGIGRTINREMAGKARELGCNSSLGEILKEPYFNRASYPKASSSAREIGEIAEIFEDAPYLWALVRVPLSQN